MRPPARPGAGTTWAAAFVVLAAALAPAGAAAQQPPPNAAWRTIDTEHFRITFQDGLQDLAGTAAAAAESGWSVLARELVDPPHGTIDILLTDHVDFSNGYANVFPSNRIVIFARPPTDSRSLQFTRSWLETVVVHELTHIFHLDATGPVGGLIRRVFGRLPLLWPAFPALATPAWSTEGLATYYESRVTGAGRVHGSYHAMVVRTAILEDAVMDVDELKAYNPTWPGGERPYIFGSLFMDHLSDRFGPDIQKELLAKTTSAWIPPFIWFDRVAKRATGKSFDALYDDWIDGLRTEYEALADSLRNEGITSSEALVTRGPYAVRPRVAPDGRSVAFGQADWRHVTRTRLLDTGTGAVRTLGRRNQSGGDLGPASWMPDGQSLVLAQLEFSDRYDLFQDLYALDLHGNERRLTRGARLAEPDVAPDGRRVAAIQTGQGATRVVVYDLQDGSITALTPRDPAVSWAAPRWAPDGRTIAVARWANAGDYDIVLLDPDGRVRPLMRDRAVDAAPAWSPDGRWILFSSDRSGIPNLYAVEVASGRLRQVTSVLTGAFDPDVSPDGRWIYFERYHADGYHLERVAFDTTDWRDPAPTRLDFQRPLVNADDERASAQPGQPRPYSALATALPRYWSPLLFGDIEEPFVGAVTGGSDLVGRHSYSIAAGYQPRHGFWSAFAGYGYAGFGNPVLGIAASRDFDKWSGNVVLTDSTLAIPYTREDRLEFSIGLLHRAWRANTGLGIGLELYNLDYIVPDRPRELLPYVDPPTMGGAFIRPSIVTYRSEPRSIAPENGISSSLTLRSRWQIGDTGGSYDRSYQEANGRLATYLALPLPGFAQHVLYARGEFTARFGSGAIPVAIGGTNTSSDVFGYQLGSSPSHSIRGFLHGDRSGDRAWSGSIDYAFPLVLRNPAHKHEILDFDRLWGTLFLDAGDAWCVATRFANAICSDADEPTLAAYGAELTLQTGFLANALLDLRAGFAIPFNGVPRGRTIYLRIGGAL